jgi:hypothetical protein
MALACAQEMVWVKPGATDADFYQMRGYCVNQAGVGMLPADVALIRFTVCMQSGGWAQVPREKAASLQGSPLPQRHVARSAKLHANSSRS